MKRKKRGLPIILIVIGVLSLSETAFGLVFVAVGVAILVLPKIKKRKQQGTKAEVYTPRPVSFSQTPLPQPNAANVEKPLTATYEIIKPKSKKALLDIKNGDYIVFDVETTGFSPSEEKIIELGMVKMASGTAETYCSFFNPGVPLLDRVTTLTGITDEDLVDAPKIDSKIDEINSFIGDLPLVAHNASFDCGFLCHAFSDAGIIKDFVVYDTLEMSRRAFPYLKDHKLNTLIRALRLSDKNQTHRALDDAKYAQMVLDRCLDELLAIKEEEAQKRKAKKQIGEQL